MKKGTCLRSFYFPMRKLSSVNPHVYLRGVRGKSRFWLCWRASAASAAGQWEAAAFSIPAAALQGQREEGDGR